MAKQISDYPPVLTVAQAAELLQYDGPGRVYELIRKKIIAPFPPGVKRGMRIHRDALLKLVGDVKSVS